MAYINDTVRCCVLRDDAVERIKHVAEKVSNIPFTIIVNNRKFFLIAFNPKREETIIFQQRTGKYICCLPCKGYEIFSHGDKIEEAIVQMMNDRLNSLYDLYIDLLEGQFYMDNCVECVEFYDCNTCGLNHCCNTGTLYCLYLELLEQQFEVDDCWEVHRFKACNYCTDEYCWIKQR